MFFLRAKAIQWSVGVFICKSKYATEVLNQFGIQNYNPVSNPIVPGQKIRLDEDDIKVDANNTSR